MLTEGLVCHIDGISEAVVYPTNNCNDFAINAKDRDPLDP